MAGTVSVNDRRCSSPACVAAFAALAAMREAMSLSALTGATMLSL
jgi:hypothetical protein